MALKKDHANLARKHICYYFINEGSFSKSERTCFNVVLISEFELRAFNISFLMSLLWMLCAEISFGKKNTGVPRWLRWLGVWPLIFTWVMILVMWSSPVLGSTFSGESGSLLDFLSLTFCSSPCLSSLSKIQ